MVKRRTKKKTRRSRTKGVSVIGLAETYMLTNVATQTLFRTNPIQFMTSKAESGSTVITLNELINPKGRFYNNPTTGQSTRTDYIMNNIRNNWVKGLMGMVLIPLGFKLGRNVAKPAISRSNRLLGKAGIGNTVKL